MTKASLWNEIEQLERKIRRTSMRINTRISVNPDRYLRKLRLRYLKDEDCCQKDLR